MIEITELCKRYDDVQALDQVSLNVQDGEILGLVGANGAGKSTLLKCLVGLIKADSGSIKLNGMTPSLESRKFTGYAAETPLLYDYLTGLEYLQFIGGLRGMNEADLNHRSQYYIDLFSLKDKAPIPIADYSHGMRQKISLAAALLAQPQLLLVDEPTNGLDPESVFNLKKELAAAAAAGGTIIFSSHMLDTVEKICHRVAIVHRGQLVACDTVDRLLNGSHHLEEVYMGLIRKPVAHNTRNEEYP
jgi:ABC-2 type transport system ATP-binding protein